MRDRSAPPAFVVKGLAACLSLLTCAEGAPTPTEAVSTFMNIPYKMLAIVCISLLLWLLWNNRKAVLVAITGDDRLHGGFIDFVWWFFCRGCGLCTGEWTRWLTLHCPCCPASWRGRNLIRLAAQTIGLTTNQVEISNIVIGDLPFSGHGDFYINFEVGNFPPMTTNVAEESLAKVVHFPEVMTLRLRNSPLESKVKITVYELNFAGSEKLCSVYLCPQNCINWADDKPRDCGTDLSTRSQKLQSRCHRFLMEVADGGITREADPWICMEFSQPAERRVLNDLSTKQGGYSYEPFFVRIDEVTGIPDGDVYDSSIRDPGDRTKKDYPLADFKHAVQLEDTDGNFLHETSEGDLKEIHLKRWRLTRCCQCIWLLIFSCVICYLIFRFYLWSCYRQLKWMTVAEHQGLLGEPRASKWLVDNWNECQESIMGLSLSHLPLGDNRTACAPNETSIVQFCQAVPLAEKPRAFKELADTIRGLELGSFIRKLLGSGVHCYEGVCKHRDFVAQWLDPCMIPLAILLPIAVFASHTMIDRSVQRLKKRKRDRKNDETRQKLNEHN